MIEIMALLACVVGLMVGWLLLAHRRIDYIVLVVYFLHVRSQAVFEAMYANADDRPTFERYKVNDSTVRSYADYLRLHDMVRKTAYKRYRTLYTRLLRSVLFYTCPAIILLAIIFTKWWPFYLLGVGATFATRFMHRIIVTKHRARYYQGMMVATLLVTYQKEQSKQI